MAKEMSKEEAYKILGLDIKDMPTLVAIKKKYYELARQNHTDKGGAKEAMQALNNAKEIANKDAEYREKQNNPKKRRAKSASEPTTNVKHTELMSAAIEGDYKKIIGLLEKGANINEQDTKGKTALMYAVEKGNYHAIQTLILKNADQLLKDKEGKTAVDMTKGYSIQASLARQAFVEVLSEDIWKERAYRMGEALKGNFSKFFDSTARNELRKQQQEIIRGGKFGHIGHSR